MITPKEIKKLVNQRRINKNLRKKHAPEKGGRYDYNGYDEYKFIKLTNGERDIDGKLNKPSLYKIQKNIILRWGPREWLHPTA